MTQEEFTTQFTQELSNLLEGIAEIIVNKDVLKINECKTGISIRYPESEISPTLYPEDIYSNLAPGETPAMAAEMAVKMLEAAKVDAPTMEDIDLTPEGAKKNLYLVVINAEKNKELLKDVPHFIQDDLAVIPRYRISDEASFVIHNNHLETFQMTETECLEQALKNTDERGYTVDSIEEVLRRIMRNEGMDDDYMDDVLAETPKSPFYVITNDSKVDGAVAIASKAALEQAYEVVGENFYILPSSRHEILALPESLVKDPEELRQMVCDVNENQVEPKDRLSDNVYYYDAQKKHVSLVEPKAVEKPMEIAEAVTKNPAKVK